MPEATLMDDDFFDICMNDNIPCVQKIVRLVLDNNELQITQAETQREFRGFMRSLRLDVYAADTDGAIYNIEVQVSNEGAVPKRSRFHCSMIDVYHLDKRQNFSELPETYVIFITKNDVLGYGKTVYTINRYIEGVNQPFNDEQHIVYVNCSAENDGSEVWKLIHDMTCKDPDEMLIPELAERVRYFKEPKKGRGEDMSSIFSELFDEERAEGRAVGLAEGRAEGRAEVLAETQREKEGFVTNLIKAGVMTLDKVAETFNMPLAEVQALAQKAGL